MSRRPLPAGGEPAASATSVAAAAPTAAPAMRFDLRELAGAVADVGVLIPIATALIVVNGLAATAVLLPAGLLYVTAAVVYRLPVPVQPLKAFGAIAIAEGMSADAIAAGALLLGGIFLVLGPTGLIDRAGRAFAKPLIRGVQLTVGLLFLEVAWRLVTAPPSSFADHGAEPTTLVALAVLVFAAALALRRRRVALALVGAALVIALTRMEGGVALGPSSVPLPDLDAATLWTALVVLVVPQLPLTFANSCIATADAARTYFGSAAARVRPGRLATTLGAVNLFSGAIAGMPVCHGAGGMTAHRAFGARTGGAPLAIGTALVVVAVVFGAGLAAMLSAFPLPVLAGLLAAAGALHIGLLGDLRGGRAWAVALTVGGVGFALNLAVALAVGLALWWLPRAARQLRRPSPPAA